MRSLGSGSAGRDWVWWLLGSWIFVLLAVLLPNALRAQAFFAPAEASAAPSFSDAAPGASVTGVIGRVTGVVVDGTDAAVPGAEVRLEGEANAPVIFGQSAEDGSFALEHVPAGSYRVTVQRPGFEAWHGEAKTAAGEELGLGRIGLGNAISRATVEVRASNHDVAEAQMELAEHQRVLGVFPNFYAAYAPDTEPLSAGQKLRLAVRFAGDPVAFAMAGVVAGSEQRAGAFAGYGSGAAGYMKRFGAAYTDGLTSTMLGQAVLPAVLHQDPRYFVKGTGSVGSRVLYAMASMVICKGDNRRWQMNYSNVLGNFASAGISNLYYPSAQRGASLVMNNALTATALGAVGGLFQEFLLHRMTPGVPEYETAR